MMCLSLPGKVISLSDDDVAPMALVDFGGVSKEVCIVFTPEVQLGQYVVVHVGFAITILNIQQALATLEIAELL